MAKKTLFDEGDEGSASGSEEAQGQELKINEEFARRFEYNKKREEKQRRTLFSSFPTPPTTHMIPSANTGNSRGEIQVPAFLR